MTTLADVRDGITEVLANTLPGVQVNRLPVDNVNPPAVIVAGMQLAPDSFGDGYQVTVDLYVVVSRRNVDSVDDLDRMLDPGLSDSIPSAIHSDQNLGDRVMSAKVAAIGEYREMEVNGTKFYAATVTVEVLR